MELQTFTQNLENLGYKYISLTEEDKAFLKNYGGVYYSWSHKHDANLTSMTICSCGMKSPYVVNQCVFCGNTNFRQQLSATRKMKKENIDKTIVEEVVITKEEEKKYKMSKKYKLNIVLYETMFNFIKDELFKDGQNDILYIGLINDNGLASREVIIFNEQNEQIPIIEFMKKMKLTSRYDAGNFIVKILEPFYGGNINFYNISHHSYPSNYSHDRLQQELNQTLFMKNSQEFMAFFDYKSSNYNRNNYDFSKKKHEFFKVNKYPLDYLLSLNNKIRSYGVGLLTYDNILKLRKMNDFINEELFVKHPELNNVTFDTIYHLFKIISCKKIKEKHTIEGVFSYCDYLIQNEALTFEKVIELYSEYLRKVKKSNVEMYVKELQLKSKLA